MTSESMTASWHPAMMPNTHADVIGTKLVYPPEPESIKVEEPSLKASQPETATLKLAAPEEMKPGFPEAAQPDPEPIASELPEAGNENAPALKLKDENVESIQDKDPEELANLRNALAPSLRSPGGVELEESPVHNGIAESEHTQAGFPSEGPKHENKHLSTMSFTRTVPEEVNWGEDDEVDPEWNLSRTDTDPFKSMAKSDRTNSFPNVPPLHSIPTALPEELPRSQAEEIMNEVEHEPKDLFEDEGNDGGADFFTQQAASEAYEEYGINGTSSDGLKGFGQSFGGNYEDGQQDSEARYEEGIPLVQASEDSQNEYSTSTFADNAGDEEGFFSQVSKSQDIPDQLVAPPSFGRKSTMQVMDSLEFEPQEGAPHSSIQEHVESSLYTESSIALGADSGEVDLAEKWKAALADDEFLDGDDDELLPDDDPTENENALDPAAIFGSDDEGFLEESDDQNDLFVQNSPILSDSNGHVPVSHNPTGANNSSRYLPPGANVVPAAAPKNIYAPIAPLLTDLSRPVTTGSTPTPYMAVASGLPLQQQPERPNLPKAQSFANQSKGGYASPYDLPMEVVKPRVSKRTSMQQIGHSYSAPSIPPPSRSSSMYTQPSAPPRGSTSGITPPTSSHGPPSNQPQSVQPPRSNSNGGFFEELPMSHRPKPAVRHPSTVPSPVANNYGPPTGAPQQYPPAVGQPPFTPPIQQQPSSYPSGLVAPQRVDPYTSLPTGSVPPPAIASRYSPAPPPQQNHTAPPPISRTQYSPAPPIPRQLSQNYAPPPANASTPPILAHQPRTSSPLAHFERNHDSRQYGSENPNFDRRTSSGHGSSLRMDHLPPTREVDEVEQTQASDGRNYGSLQYPNPPQATRMSSQTPPPPQTLGLKSNLSPSKRSPSNYLPQPSVSGNPPTFTPPQRSHTQSPGTAFTGSRLDMAGSAPYQRPASVEAPISPRNQVPISTYPIMSQGRPRAASQAINYIAPTDGRENDPLQRWKGSPVFAWGVGGTIITSFPKDIPRYGMTQTAPMIIRSPGEVKITNIKELDPLPERLTSFPGPLKGKSKKKEVVSWLSTGVQIMEHNASYLRNISHLTHEDKRIEERILLWKILQVYVENDGILEGNAVVDKAVRAVLSPDLENENGEIPIYATGADLSGISHSSNSATRSDPVDPASVDQLRKHLLRGEREKAVWEAVDKRLWAHAMLISNTVSKDLYKQVAQEFVQKEVKNTGDNTESLAALYEIFAGNFEESIDELVPPSARAGFQMVSTSNSAGPSKDALDGLDRWRETLGLVLSNRSVDDIKALNALGKLLSGYGRAEAAHICFLFARNASIFGGIDDPLSSIVLVGSNHLRQPFEFDKELEPILLSEVFEYGATLAGTSNVAVSYPHLSIYKLQHATVLAEYGYREKALQYCESVASSITSQTRRSPYHHALLLSALDDLRKRLKQSPKEQSSSWLSKPSMDKVSGTVWDTLSKFVAGDENDTSATGSAGEVGGEVGPFSRIAGGTPTISRSPSTSDIYGGYSSGLGINGVITVAPATNVSSRYAPGRTYTPEPRNGSYISQPRSSLEGRSSGEHQRYEPQRQTSDHISSSQSGLNQYAPHKDASYTPQSSYTSQGTNGSPYTPQMITPATEHPSSNLYSSPQPINNMDGSQQPAPFTPPESSYGQQPSFGYEPPVSSYEPPAATAYEPPTSTFEPPSSSGYEPPTSGYEPPSYEPASMGDEPPSPVETRKKKSFMDDDEDDIPALKQAPASQGKTKAEKDREADEAFRKAAEADAQKIAASPAKKGWGLGGWFGGGKKVEAADMSQPNKPIRAKLGEASSFIYDPDLKRWINKKGGDTAPTPTATPPPPKAGPPRIASGPPSFGPTSVPRGPSMRSASDTSNGPSASPLSQGEGPLPDTPTLAPPFAPTMSRSVSNGSAGPPSAPPSRPGTGMSNASSIDDLLGPATGGSRKGTAKKKKGRGYVDVMGEKAS